MRPVRRGQAPKDHSGNAIVFAEFQEARDALVTAIGDFCSYCEVCLHSTIAVEHVSPQSLNPQLVLQWDNFLLACVNCNSTKGTRGTAFNDYYWPDRDNTARAFEYWPDEPPRLAGSLTPAQRTIANRTLELTGLDRVPGHQNFSDRDRRWKKRKEVWGIALMARGDLNANDSRALRNWIVQTAISRGFWSVWMAVFHDDPDMRQRLLSWFPGTAVDCFDGEAKPIPGLGGAI